VGALGVGVEALAGEIDRIRQILTGGSALGDVQAPGEIDLAGLTVSAQSATFRVVAGSPDQVGVFRGTATLAMPGATLSVPAFRQAAVAGGALPAAPQPLQIVDGGDVWDHRYLQDAIDLDTRLANFRGGLDAQLGNATGRDFFRVVTGDTAKAAYVAPYFAQPRSDVLIGLVIANKDAAASHADPQATFNQVMTQWLAGESWGLVALEDHLSAQDVFAGLVDAISKVGISLKNPTPIIAPLPTSSTKPRTPSPSPSATSRRPGASSGPTNPTPSATPTPLVDQVLEPITKLVNELLNLLLPTPTTTVTPAH